MKITRNGSVPSKQADPSHFSGEVRIEANFKADAPATLGGGVVAFSPGGRTAWHSHPRGQILYVLSGRGWVQREGAEIETVLPGDIVWFEPGEKHWHGATDTTAMRHLALAEAVDGQSVVWGDEIVGEIMP